MKDSELVVLIGNHMLSALAATGSADIPVSQKDSPTQQGIPDGPCAYFEKLFDIPRGWPVNLNFDSPEGYIERTTQMVETSFQISAFVWQNPAKPLADVKTASDIVNDILMFFVARSQRRVLKNSGVQILRVTEVRNPYFENDRSQFEAAPSFDIVLVHLRTLELVTPYLSIIEGEYYPVLGA